MTGLRGRTKRTLLACMLVALALPLVAASSALADASVNWGGGLGVTPPADAGSNPQEAITGVSCATTGNCVAVGSYKDAAGQSHALIAVESAGHRSTGPQLTLPVNANSTSQAGLNAVSCPAAGNCSAVGHYIDMNGVTQGLIVRETNGQWGTAREVFHPQGARVNANPRISLNSISCATPSDCSAVGVYSDNVNDPEGIIVTENGGTFQPYAQVPLPAGAADEPNTYLASVSCGAAGECAAVGSYVDGSGHTEGLLLTETGGNWQPGVAATPPGNANANPDLGLNSVSCSTAGECATVGNYNDTSNNTQGVMITETGGAWQPGTEAALPAGAASSPAVVLSAVSCSSPGNCAAVGDYNDTALNLQGLLLDETGGVWGQGVEASLPGNAGSTVFVQLLGVSCFADGQCAATGNYTDGSFAAHPVLLSEANGSWAQGVEGTTPYAGSSPQANVEAVSCAAGGDCLATVNYLDNQSNSLAATFNGTPAAPSSPTLALAAPPATAENGIALPASDFGATLSGGTSETGTVTFKVYGPQSSAPTDCATGGTTIGTATVQGDGAYAPSGGFTPSAAGDYWTFASYDGDLSNNPVTTTCGAQMAETVVSTTALSLSVPSTDPVNTDISAGSIGATLSGATGGATGTLTYTVFGPQRAAPTSCDTGGTTVGTASVSGNGTYTPSADFTPTASGNYWWYVTYSGDSGDPAAVSTCGTGMAETTVPTNTSLTLNAPASTGAVGSAISPAPSAALSGGTGETGTVTFTVFGPQSAPPTSCTSGGVTAGTVSVQGDGTYTLPSAFVPGAPGQYWWYASYGGDQGDNPSATSCGSPMPSTNVKASPGLALSVPSSATLGSSVLGAFVSATLASGSGETGNLHFTVFGPQASPPSSCGSGGTAVGTRGVSGDGSYSSPSDFKPSVPGDYWWYASYDGDGGNAPAASPCGAGMPATVITSPSGGGSGSGGSSGGGTPAASQPVMFTKFATSGSNLKATFLCEGNILQICSDTITLTVTEKLSGGKVVAVSAAAKRPASSVTGVVTVGSAKVKLNAGKSRVVSIALNRAARLLLASRYSLPVRIQVVQGSTFQTKTVTFRIPKPKPKPKPKAKAKTKKATRNRG